MTMKKTGFAILSLFALLCAGCSIDYTSYYGKYGNVYNKDGTIASERIDSSVRNYPSADANATLVSKYSDLYADVTDQYEIYATYYSAAHDVIYISYDKIDDKKQTIGSKELALMEEHLMY